MKKSFGPNTFMPTTPVLLVGTYDEVEKPNLMTAAWGGICCSKPPCVSVSLRKATYSYAGIVARKAFTIGIPSASQAAQADYMGIASGRKLDKFAEAGWSAVRGEHVDAPYAGEVPFVLECRLVHSAELGLHTLFVGEILDVKADEAVLGEDGLPDMAKLAPFVFDTMHKDYYGLGQVVGKAFSIGKK